MEVRNKPVPVKREAEGEVGLAARELERYQSMTERERSDFNQVNKKGFQNFFFSWMISESCTSLEYVKQPIMANFTTVLCR